MSDHPNEHDGGRDGGIEPDPALTAALRSMEPPPHGEGFWDRLDARLDAEPVAAPVTVATLPPTPPEPPLAEVVPLTAPRRRGPQRWLAAAAAAVVVVLAATALFRSTSTDVTTTPPAATTTLPSEPSTSAPPSTVPEAPPTSSSATTAGPATPPAPGTATPAPPKPASPTTARRPTTTTGVDPLVLSTAGVGPLRMGMIVRQAQATGAMTDFSDQSGSGTCGVGYGAGTYRRGDLGALFLDGRLARVYAEGESRLRTPQGIGIGSPASALSSVPGTRSEQPNPYLEGATDVLIAEGGTGYLFTVEQGIVRSWSAGTRAALELKEACS